MALQTKAVLQGQAIQIRDETVDFANTAIRVGSHLLDAIDSKASINTGSGLIYDVANDKFIWKGTLTEAATLVAAGYATSITGGDVTLANSTFQFHIGTGLVLTDLRGTPLGMQYAADYSATYVDRSIPDWAATKAYADNLSYTLGSLTDTNLAGLINDQTIIWNGSKWVPIDFPNSAIWGSITGTLSNQTDLQNALDLYELALGNPGTNGYVLASLTNGTRVWVPPASQTFVSLTDTNISSLATGNLVKYDGANWINVVPSNTGLEVALGNPSTSGYVLSSTSLGVRSWVANAGGAGGGVDVNRWYCANSGNDSTGDGSAQLPYRTIQKAHDVAAGGDEVVLLPGFSSSSSLTITKDLVITGASRIESQLSAITLTGSITVTLKFVYVSGNITGSSANLICHTTTLSGILTTSQLLLHANSYVNLNSGAFSVLKIYSSETYGATDPTVSTSFIIDQGSRLEHGINSSGVVDSIIANAYIDGDISHSGEVRINNSDITGTLSGISGTIILTNQNGNLLKKFVNIGNWDMDTTAAKAVAHGVDVAKIRSISGMIIDDAGTRTQPIGLSHHDGTGMSVYIDNVGVTNVSIERTDSGQFDSPNWSDDPYNRGWLVIEYLP